MAGIVSQSGAVRLSETAKVVGLLAALNTTSAPWRKPFAIQDQTKIVLDQDWSLPIEGNALADADRLRAQPAVFCPVASDSTVSRLIKSLALTPRRN